MLSKKTQNTLAVLLAWLGPWPLLLLVLSSPSAAYLVAYIACAAGPIAVAMWWVKQQ